jgi:hypothetical protein
VTSDERKPNDRYKSLVREVVVFAAFLALAVVLTWPFAIRINTAVPDLGDPLLNAWIVDWVCWALLHQPLDLFDAPIFHPAELPLAFSENLIGVALFALPFHLAGLPALTVYNIVFLLGFAHAAYGGWVLGRVVTRSTVPSLIAGIFFGFVSFKFDHLSHLQIVWSGWLPLMLAALIVWWRRPSAGRAALLAAAFLMNGLTNIHFLLFGSIALVLAVATLALFRVERRWQAWLQLAVAMGIAGALLLPVLAPYREVRDLYGMKRDAAEVEWFSATWSDWLNTTTRARFYGRYMTDEVRHERALFPGMLPIFFLACALLLTPRRAAPAESQADDGRGNPRALLRVLDVAIVALAALIWFGAVTHRFTITSGGELLLALRGVDIPAMLLAAAVVVRLAIRFPAALGGADGRSLRTAARSSRFPDGAWAAAVWIIIGVLGSLGLNGFFHDFLFQRVEGFAALRVPARWAIITYTGLAAWSALGAAALLERRSAIGKRLLSGALLLLAAGEVVPIIRWEHAPVDTPPVYRWLNDVRIGPVLELPTSDDDGAQFLYLLYATKHRVPIMNGTSGFEPPVHLQLRDAYQNRHMDDDFTRLLERHGARLVIVHGDRLTNGFDQVTAWIGRAMAAGRLAFLRRFDSGLHGDYVFALTANLPDWRTYRAIGERDRAGFTPDENLSRFMKGEAVYNATLFGRLETPRPHETHQRPLRIGGWALSPDGIRSATARIDNGRLLIPLELHERPDVVARYPWYPATPRPGFAASVPRRPKGTPRETDLQIEIVDGAGRRLHLRDLPFRWD